MKNKFNTPVLALLAMLIAGAMVSMALAQVPAPQPAPAAPPAAGAPPQLAENAPTRYEVKKGDTLWSIAARFLKSPWRWNELWRMNKDQVRNPHRIYPGEVLVLTTGADGRPQLSVAPAEEPRPTITLSPTMRVTPINTEEIPSIPPAIIDPFLNKPLIVAEGALASAPRIVGGPDTKVVLATGYKVYATGLDEKGGTGWQIYRPAKPLYAVGRKEVLGYEAEYLGDAIVDRFGEVATLKIVSSRKEIMVGDRLVPVPRERIISYPPHSPDRDIDGRIIALPTSLVEGGRGSILTLDIGAREGLELGHVLAVYHDPGRVPVSDEKNWLPWQKEQKTLQLPNERIGLAFVFRVFDKISYALVLNSTKQVELGDSVKKP